MLHRFSVSLARGCFPLLLFLAALCAASVSRALEVSELAAAGTPVTGVPGVLDQTTKTLEELAAVSNVISKDTGAKRVIFVLDPASVGGVQRPEAEETLLVLSFPVGESFYGKLFMGHLRTDEHQTGEITDASGNDVRVVKGSILFEDADGNLSATSPAADPSDNAKIVDTVPAAVDTPVTDAIEKTTGVGKKLADIFAAISNDSGAKRVIFVLGTDVEGTLLVLSYPAAESHSTPTVGLIKTDEHQTGKLTDVSGNDFRVVKGSVLFEDADGNLSTTLFEDADGNLSATPPAADPSDNASDSAEGEAAPESSNPPVRHSMRFDVAPGGGIHSDSDEFNRVNDEIVGRESPLSYGEFLEMADSHDFDSQERLMLWKVMADRQNPPISKDSLKELYEAKRASISDFMTTIYRFSVRSPFVYALKGDDYRLMKTISECSSGDSEKVIYTRIESFVKSEYRHIHLYNHPDPIPPH